MADLIPSGVDSSTGQNKPLTSSDQLVDSSGNPIVDNTPNVAGWGVNTETLSGSKTLTDSDPVLQVLNPDGANRDVNLPALTTSSPYFIILNTSAAEGPGEEDNNRLYVLDTAGTIVATVDPRSGRYFVNDGSGTWYSFQAFDLESRGSAKFPIFFNTDDVGGGLQDAAVPTPLTVSTCYYSNNTASATTVTLYQNGISTGSTFTTSATNGHGQGVFSTPVTFAAGDTLSARAASGIVKLTIPYDSGITGLTFSGNADNSDDYADVGYSSSSLGTSLVAATNEVYIPFDCSYVGIGFNQENFGGGETIRVYVNGSLSQTSSAIAAADGFISLTETALSAGDTVALRCGTSAAGMFNWTLFLKCKYTAYQFAGNAVNGNDSFAPYGNSTSSTGLYTSNIGDTFQVTAVDNGKLAFVSFITTNATSNVVEVLASGQEDYVVGSLSNPGDVVVTRTKQLVTEGFQDFRSRNYLFDAGTRMGLAFSNASNAQGASNLVLWMQH